MSNRDEYIEKAKARLEQWNADIEKMQAKVDEAQADALAPTKRAIKDRSIS